MESQLPDHWEQIWKFAPVVAALVVALWAGHRGFWYWGKSVRAVMKDVERQRDEWRELALVLLRQRGIETPPTVSPRSMTEALKNGGMGK